jgi:hypothetical protein
MDKKKFIALGAADCYKKKYNARYKKLKKSSDLFIVRIYTVCYNGKTI